MGVWRGPGVPRDWFGIMLSISDLRSGKAEGSFKENATYGHA